MHEKPSSPLTTVGTISHHGNGGVLVTEKARADFIAMAQNRLKDESFVDDFAPGLIAQLPQRITGDWTRPAIIKTLKTLMADSSPPVCNEDQARVLLVVRAAFSLAAAGKLEYKPHPYADGLRGDACKELVGKALIFFSDPGPYLRQGDAGYNAQVHHLFSCFGEELANGGFGSSVVRREQIADIANEVGSTAGEYMGADFAKKYQAYLEGAYDRIHAEHPSDLPYVNIPNDRRGRLMRLSAPCDEWDRD